MKLRLPYACQPGCDLCAGVPALDAGAVDAALQHAEKTNQHRIYVQGTNVGLNPDLPAIVRSARARSRQVAIIEDGSGLGLPAAAPSLRGMGVEFVYLSWKEALLAIHTPEPQVRGLLKQALAVLLTLQRAGDVVAGVHVALRQPNVTHIRAVLRLLARLSFQELLISDVHGEAGALEATAAVAVLERAWLAAAALRMRLRLIGFARTRYLNPPIGEPAPCCDGALIEMIRQRIPLSSARGGVRALGTPEHPSGVNQLVKSPESLRHLGLELAARRSPFVDLPPCLGGTQLAAPAATKPPTTFIKSAACPSCPFDERCPGAQDRLDAVPRGTLQSALRPLPTWYAFRRPPRVLMLLSQGGDPVFYMSTLPALAQALRKRGATVEIVSPWLARWIPQTLPALSHDEHAYNWMGTTQVEAWLKNHALGSFDLVLASDFPTARVALAAGSLSAAARIVVVDFHMLEGMDLAVAAWLAPHARATEGGWWPSKQLVLESAFPAHVQLYLNYGVPLEHIAWRPFALHPGHFPAGPDVHACDVIFSGGDHLRDVETLRAASERLPGNVHPLDLYAFGEAFGGNAHLRHRGSLQLDAFHRALANSRFVVLPLREDTTRAAGITVLAMALMAGRPLVATNTAAICDYVQHGAEALLVPPGDPAALADAITRLDTDPALLSALSEGARLAGQRFSTEHWADQIVSGEPPPTPLWTPFGWRNW